jgi:hypothetical protein
MLYQFSEKQVKGILIKYLREYTDWNLPYSTKDDEIAFVSGNDCDGKLKIKLIWDNE